jgi:DNA-directed RNA polymerase specialized sigma24 family protein
MEHIHSARDRTILERRLIDGVTFERIATEMDMSPRQIKNIVYKEEQVLFRKLH